MPASARSSANLAHFLTTFRQVLSDIYQLVLLLTRPRVAIAAENLFLRKQLALFQERNVKPDRATDSTRWLMAFLSRTFDWRAALVVVKPDRLIRWHRQGFRLF
jgi:putative transposase